MKLKDRWALLMSRLGIDRQMNAELSILLMRYNSSERFYHNLNHINYSMAQFDTHKHLIESPDLVELAIFYHDAIYNFGDSAEFNELKSFEQCTDDFFYDLDDLSMDKVESLIMTTKIGNEPTDIDECYMVDIDMSGLASDWMTYQRYQRAIRKEYSKVPDNVFYKARRDFLLGLMENGVFRSPYFKAVYEKAALRNISSELRIMGK